MIILHHLLCKYLLATPAVVLESSDRLEDLKGPDTPSFATRFHDVIDIDVNRFEDLWSRVRIKTNTSAMMNG